MLPPPLLGEENPFYYFLWVLQMNIIYTGKRNIYFLSPQNLPDTKEKV